MAGKTWRTVLLLLLVFAGGGTALLLTTDAATDLVGRLAQETVTNATGATLELEHISGNPLRGYTVGGVRLVKNGGQVFAAKEVALRVGLFSILSGNPFVSSLTVSGADIDTDATNALLKDLGGGEPAGTLPLGTVSFRDSSVRTPFGTVLVRELSLRFREDTLEAELDVAYGALPVTGAATFRLPAERLAVSRLDLRVGKGTVAVAGAVAPHLALEGTFKDMDGAELAALWPDLPGPLSGTFSLHLRAEGTWQKPVLLGQLSLDKGNVAGIPLDGVAASFASLENTLHVNDLKGNAFGIPLSGEASFVFQELPPEMTVTLKGSGIALASLARLFPELEAAQGTLDEVTLALSGKGGAPDGRVTLRAKRLVLSGQEFADTVGEIKVRGGKTLHVTFRSNGLGSPLSLGGTIVLEKTPVLKLDFKGNALNLARVAALAPGTGDLAMAGNVVAALQIGGTSAAPTLSGTLSSEKIQIRGEPVTKPSATFSFAKDTLSLKSATFVWRGGTFSAAGTVRNLPKAPAAELSGRVDGVDLRGLAGMFPALGEYALSGTASAAWSVKGNLEALTGTLEAHTPTLQAMGNLSVRQLKIGGAFALTGGTPSLQGPLKIQAASLAWKKLALTELSLGARTEGTAILLDNTTAGLAGGTLTLTGKVGLPDGKNAGSLDLKGSAKDVGLGSLASALDLPVPLAGKAEGTFAVSGPPENLAGSAELASPALSVAAFSLANAAVSATFTAKSGAPSPWNVTISSARATVNGAPFTAEGTLRAEGDDTAFDLRAEGKDLDLAHLLKDVQALRGKGVNGRTTLALTLARKGGILSGSGSATSPQAGAFGLSATEISLPFTVDKNILAVSSGKGRFHEGTATLSLRANLASGGWETSLGISGANMDQVIRSAAGSRGSVGGRANLTFKGTGNAGSGSFSGTGNLDAAEGAVTGYSWVNLLAAVHGAQGVRYKTLTVPFKVQQETLTLLPGTKAEPYPNDPLYRALSATGTVTAEKLNLDVKGNVNIQVINALLGGIQGGLLGGGQNIRDILQGALTGFSQSGGSQDFRDVSCTVQGPPASPGVSNLKVAPGKEQPRATPVPETASPQPTPMPQAPKPSPSLEDTIKETILKNILGN
jgi:translocation and assembly module TamB